MRRVVRQVLLAVLSSSTAFAAFPMAASAGTSTAAAGENVFKAGYSTPPLTGELRLARAKFVVPGLDCASRRGDGIGVGIGSQPELDTPRHFAGVEASCVDHEARYTLVARVGDTVETSASVAAGDEIRVSIKRHRSGRVTAILQSLDGDHVQVIAAGDPGSDPTENVADFGAFPLIGHDLKTVPDFGDVAIQHATVRNHSGETWCAADVFAERNTRVDRQSGEVEIDASGPARCRFSIVYVSH